MRSHGIRHVYDEFFNSPYAGSCRSFSWLSSQFPVGNGPFRLSDTAKKKVTVEVALAMNVKRKRCMNTNRWYQVQGSFMFYLASLWFGNQLQVKTVLQWSRAPSANPLKGSTASGLSRGTVQLPYPMHQCTLRILPALLFLPKPPVYLSLQDTGRLSEDMAKPL